MFGNFVQKFQQHTVDNGQLSTYELIYKYISTFEHMAPSFGVETFLVSSLELRKETDESLLFSNTTHAQGASKESFNAFETYEIMVTGTKGIQYRKLSTQKVCWDFLSELQLCCVFCKRACISCKLLFLYSGEGEHLLEERPRFLHKDSETAEQPDH